MLQKRAKASTCYAMLPAMLNMLDNISNKEWYKRHPRSPKSCTEAIMRALQIVISMLLEKEMEHKEEKRYMSFGHR